MYLYASLTFVLLFAERTVPNTQPPLISTLVLQNALLAYTNISSLPNTQIQWQHGISPSDACLGDEKILLFRPRWKMFLSSKVSKG